jgi:Bacteriophage Mu, Gp27
MGTRSKVLTMLPKGVRDDLNQKLIAGEFSDYRGLEKWLAGQGFRISRGSLQRYGSQFEKRLAGLSRATQQVKALAEVAPDRQGAMSDALIQLVQSRLFDVLIESENIDDAPLARFARAIADLGRATVSQKKWAEIMRTRLEEQKRAAGEKIEGMKSAGGLSDAAYEQIRAVLLGINPLPAV